MNKKTIRLVVPDWQAGSNPIYSLGSRILTAIAPDNSHQTTLTVPISLEGSARKNGVNNQDAVKENFVNTKRVIAREQPSKIITLGGNYFVSQAPIDYLNGQMNNKMGIIWVDAHPDISNPRIFDNEHAMVVANLLKKGDPLFNELVDHPLQPRQIFYAGLQEPTIDEQKRLTDLGVSFGGHHRLSLPATQDWARRNQFDSIYLHLDLDVLNPADFYSTYLNNPHLQNVPANAARGDVDLATAFSFIKKINQHFKLVGLTIAEYMPWSAQQLYQLMQDLPLFRN